MISSFSQYLVEEERTVYFTFGRMNPPTIGHGKLLDKLASVAGRNPYRVFLSQSNDPKENPLPYADKIKHVRKMFPKHARSVMINKKVKTPFHALSALYDEGFRKVVMVAGSDRISEYDIRLNKYNGKKGGHGFYNFDGGINLVSAGQRDPDAKGAEGASGTKQRGFANDNNFTSFAQNLPKAMSNSDARRLFNAVRNGMGLKEEKTFKNHVQLESVSERREQFASGNLFSVGDEVIVKETNEIAKIDIIGSNYVIVEQNGNRKRMWLDAVEKIEESYQIGTPEYNKHVRSMTPGQKVEAQDSDIKDREGTQPKRYHAGLAKATKIRRDRHFKKHGKKDDDDPSAYKPAPGDADAETKPSKYTKIVKKMVDEDSPSAQDLAKMKIDREKKADMTKHDRMMDRARTKDTKAKNMEEGSFADKSKASGISTGTLKKVYQRGVAAWKTGHRPGTTPSQWGHARVNAFIAKKKKGNLNHDKDLA